MVIYYHNYGQNMISFRSKITVKILDYFFLNQDAKSYINELAKILDLDPKNVDRKLKSLEKEGLLASEFQGKERYFFINKKYPLLENYRQIFLKTVGLEKRLKEILLKIPNIKEAYIFGSYVKNKMDSSSDIDILTIGDHSIVLLQKTINKLQKSLGREINIVNLSPKEFLLKKRKKNPFIMNIFAGRYIKLI